MSNNQKNIIITGASGFVGRCVISELLRDVSFYKIFALAREPTFIDSNVNEIIIKDIGDISWLESFHEKIDCIVHIAGLAHNKFGDGTDESLSYFREVNTVATKKLVEKALEIGVKRFVFISSIGVLGTSTKNLMFDDFTPVSPSSDYAISKYEAELEIKQVCERKKSSMDYVIIRSPLVYGSEAPGNFLKLLRLVRCGLPLPLLSVRNSRSFIDCYNLASFIVCCVNHAKASNQVFLIADDENISTPDLVKCLSEGMKSKTILLPFPVSILKIICTLARKKNIYEQLCCSLEIDSSRAKELLEWSAPNKALVALLQAANGYRDIY
ncbi:MAG: NAD-dependent epimerase/dehydratase family protein [Cellvibrionaceae bacterium]